ncbi:hypothetical protein E4U32_001061 [Claviceps aff. humidiphila group G2b]|nr:hypothetical protein E4U32_001061 [Claviceps aff. humidiphila group G2b]
MPAIEGECLSRLETYFDAERLLFLSELEPVLRGNEKAIGGQVEGYPACGVGAHELGKDDKFLLDTWMEDFGNDCRDKNSPAWMRTGSIVDQWSGIATETS